MNAMRNRRSVFKFLLAALAVAAASCSTQSVLADKGPEEPELKLVFFSDVHARTEWGTPDAMARAAAAINAQQPDLIIAGGDLITDGFQSSAASVASRWDAYMTMHNALEAPVRPVMGNHDLVAAHPEDGTEPSADPRSVFKEKMGLNRTFYSFDMNGYHFIVLDSVQVGGFKMKYQGMVGVEQLKWIAEDLREVPAEQPIIVALHLPLLTSFYQATEGATIAAPAGRVVVNNRDVLDLFKGHNLLLVLQGHLHASESIYRNGTTFITTGAISGQWWRGPWKGSEEGFTVVTLKDNEIDWKYISYEWEARRPRDE